MLLIDLTNPELYECYRAQLDNGIEGIDAPSKEIERSCGMAVVVVEVCSGAPLAMLEK